MRKINESMLSSLKIDVVNLSSEFPEISIDSLATELSNNLGVDIRKQEEDGTVYMVIDDTDFDTAVDEIANIIYAESDVEDLDEISSIIEDCIIDEYDYDDDESTNYPPYDFEDDELTEAVNLEELDYEWDDYDYDDDDDESTVYPPYDLDEDDEFEDDDSYYDDDDDDDERTNYPPYDFDEDDVLNDCDSYDECAQLEDEEFECYESKNYRYLGNGIYESKKGCCPKRKSPKRMVKLSEALRTRRFKKPVRMISENVINKAIKKARKSNRKYLKESLGTDKYNLIVKAMKAGKRHLYENKKINGKSIAKFSSKQLYKLLKEIQEQYNSLNKKLNSLNESASLKQEIELNEKIQNKLRLINILDEELTYRLTIKKLLEDEEMNNELEPLSVDPNEDGTTDDSEDTDENPEEDEEVELSRVVITVANQEAADELKASMVDAGIPEDAIEFETDSDISDEDEEESEEGEEETEGEEGEEETKGEAKESLYYNKFKKLLEDDGDETESDEDTEKSDDETEGDEESDDTEGEDESDEAVKVILTNTDYIHDLADVLNNEYGITKDEFEESIGGEIIEDDEENSDDEEKSDDEDSDDKKKDKKSSGDDAVDAMSPEDLDKLFGNV